MILDEEEPDVLTVYDDNGGYGHPDHIQVHRVGRRAGGAQRGAGRGAAARSTATGWRGGARAGGGRAGRRRGEDARAGHAALGQAGGEITHKVDVVDVVDRKRAAMRTHASQMGPDHPLLAMPEPMFLSGSAWSSTSWARASPAAAPDLFLELFEPARAQD